MTGQEPAASSGGPSKAYIILGNDRGTGAERLEVIGLMDKIQNQSLSDSLRITGLVYDHQGLNVYSEMDVTQPDVVGFPIPDYKEQEELVGKVLTIIDGLLVSATQAKSLKFLLKREIYQAFREWEVSVKQTYAGAKYRDDRTNNPNSKDSQ